MTVKLEMGCLCRIAVGANKARVEQIAPLSISLVARPLSTLRLARCREGETKRKVRDNERERERERERLDNIGLETACHWRF